MLTERQKGWLEGIIDSDGSLCLSKHRRSNTKRGYTWDLVLQIDSINKEFLEKIKEVIGEGAIRRRAKPKNPTWTRGWCYYMTANGLRRLLPKIRLIVKEKQRTLLLEALSLTMRNMRGGSENKNDARLNAIYLEMQSLNYKKGVKAAKKKAA